MIRSKAASSMQKTYDDCDLRCSTAVYFESQNNEPEALRSWREALDAIYYHNAYKIPSGWRPRSSTEKALQDSLRQMEIRCKERVDLLAALRESRKEAKTASTTDLSTAADGNNEPERVRTPGWLGDGTIQPTDYASIPRVSIATSAAPALPARPSVGRTSSEMSTIRAASSTSSLLSPPGTSSDRPEPARRGSRTPSPEKKGMLKTLRSGKDRRDSGGLRNGSSGRSVRPPAAAKAATQAWGTKAYRTSEVSLIAAANGNDKAAKQHDEEAVAKKSAQSDESYRATADETARPSVLRHKSSAASIASNASDTIRKESSEASRSDETNVVSFTPSAMPVYRQEYMPPQPSKYAKPPLATPPRSWDQRAASGSSAAPTSPTQRRATGQATNRIPRKAAGVVGAVQARQQLDQQPDMITQDGKDLAAAPTRQRPTRPQKPANLAENHSTSTTSTNPVLNTEEAWLAKKERVLASLPANIDTQAATQILNEVVIRGDPVAWSDISGLTTAKLALKENVIYPFLRPDLFRGLREPARGILLFGPPGTGKTMLARAVASESKSTFFSIGASSLTSKFLGESEKLVRALFAVAKACGPSIVFVDEIESLLGRRGEGGHDALERVKTEFLVGWSDLQRAAAGAETKRSSNGEEEGDASRVLVLAATNLPWLIDEAARRRFVRRQYIPLPEEETRRSQLGKLLERQRCDMKERELDQLVVLTDGFSGSDITSLAKDAAMGPLRELGERLLDTSPEDIRPISFADFKASLANIRPSVSKGSLREFEEWAAEFGERGG